MYRQYKFDMDKKFHRFIFKQSNKNKKSAKMKTRTEKKQKNRFYYRDAC